MELTYSKPIPWHRRRRSQRLVLLGVVLASFIAVAVMWGPQAWRHARVLRAQSGAGRYSRPGDQIVYLIDPQGTTPLANAQGYVDGVILTAARPASPIVHVPEVHD